MSASVPPATEPISRRQPGTDPLFVLRTPDKDSFYSVIQGKSVRTFARSELFDLYRHLNGRFGCWQRAALSTDESLMATAYVIEHQKTTLLEQALQGSPEVDLVGPTDLKAKVLEVVRADACAFIKEREWRLVTDLDDAQHRMLKNAELAAKQQERQSERSAFQKRIKSLKDCDDDSLVADWLERTKNFTVYPERKLGRYRVGVATRYNKKIRNGKPKPMQDSFAVVPLDCKVGDDTLKLTIAAVFDGHAKDGHVLSQYLAAHLPTRIRDELQACCPEGLDSMGIINAGNLAFLKAEEAFFEAFPEIKRAGSTGSVAVIIEDEGLITYNIGDSRTLLERKGEADQLTVDMDLSEDFDWGVIKRGGTVERKNSSCSYRVNRTTINMGRSVGDRQVKGPSGDPCVSTRVKTSWRSGYLKKKSALVIVSDGVTCKSSSAQIAEALDLIHKRYPSPTEQAKVITLMASEAGSTDDITTLVLRR